MKATVLVVGFGAADFPATRSLLEAGACVLQAPDSASGLAHLRGGVVSAIIVSEGASRADRAELSREAAERGVPMMTMGAEVDGATVRRRLDRALEV